jgi:hypothetical protein
VEEAEEDPDEKHCTEKGHSRHHLLPIQQSALLEEESEGVQISERPQTFSLEADLAEVEVQP